MGSMLIDNKTHGRLGEVLANALRVGSTLSILTNRFSVFAFDNLYPAITKIEALRLLVPASGDHVVTPEFLRSLADHASDRANRNR